MHRLGADRRDGDVSAARGSAGEHHVLYGTVTTEAFAQGMADAAFITYLSGLCSLAFTATHYALLSSLAR